CRERAYHRDAILLLAQRRAHLEERAVGADVVLVQRQVIDRDTAAHGETARLGRANDGEAFSTRDGRGVIAPAGDADEAHVALEHDRLGSFVHALEAEPRRDLA